MDSISLTEMNVVTYVRKEKGSALSIDVMEILGLYVIR